MGIGVFGCIKRTHNYTSFLTDRNSAMRIDWVVILSALLLRSGISSARYVRIRWEGELVVPVNKTKFGVRNPAAKWWGRVPEADVMIVILTRPHQIARFDFMEIAKESDIKVYVTRSFRLKGWRLRSRLFNVTNGSFETKGKRAIRIKANRKAGFLLKYFRGYCAVPDSLTPSGECTRKKEKRSRCVFGCKSPEFLRRNSSIISFTSTCQTNRSWSEEAEMNCVSRDEVEKQCFNHYMEPKSCPYSQTQLLAMYSEEKTGTEMHAVALNFLALRLKGQYATYSWNLPTSGLQSATDERGITGDCFKFCIQDSVTRGYKTTCGSQAAEEIMVCMQCRYIYKICDQHVVVA